MSISIYLHRVFRPYCDGEEKIQVEGSTINECLQSMTKLYPGLEKAVFTGKGKLHPLVEIYLNSASAYPDPLKKEVKNGDKLHLIHTLAGG